MAKAFVHPVFKLGDSVLFSHGSGRLSGIIVRLTARDGSDIEGEVSAAARANAVLVVSREGAEPREYTRAIALLTHDPAAAALNDNPAPTTARQTEE